MKANSSRFLIISVLPQMDNHIYIYLQIHQFKSRMEKAIKVGHTNHNVSMVRYFSIYTLMNWYFCCHLKWIRRFFFYFRFSFMFIKDSWILILLRHQNSSRYTNLLWRGSIIHQFPTTKSKHYRCLTKKYFWITKKQKTQPRQTRVYRN